MGFANVYLHELDDFIKQELRERYYLRYCDDFIILSNDKSHLKSLIISIREFLIKNLQLELHPKKLIIKGTRQIHVKMQHKDYLINRLSNTYSPYNIILSQPIGLICASIARHF